MRYPRTHTHTVSIFQTLWSLPCRSQVLSELTWCSFSLRRSPPPIRSPPPGGTQYECHLTLSGWSQGPSSRWRSRRPHISPSPRAYTDLRHNHTVIEQVQYTRYPPEGDSALTESIAARSSSFCRWAERRMSTWSWGRRGGVRGEQVLNMSQYSEYFFQYSTSVNNRYLAGFHCWIFSDDPCAWTRSVQQHSVKPTHHLWGEKKKQKLHTAVLWYRPEPVKYSFHIFVVTFGNCLPS